MNRWLSLALLPFVLTLACKAADVATSGAGGHGGSGAVVSTGGINLGPSSGSTSPTAPTTDVQPCPSTGCTDFPSTPILDQGVSSGVASQFSGSASGSGPCISEPEDGTLFPYNWQRPRISWSGGAGTTYQVTIHTDLEVNDLVVFTNQSSWTMTKDMWNGLTSHVRDKDVTVKVRAASGDVSSVTFHIAPASADGKIVFWSAVPTEVGKDPSLAKDTDDYLSGYTLGDDGTVIVLKTSQVQQPSMNQDAHTVRKVLCIGCHAATPDSHYVGFNDHWPWNSAIAGISTDTLGTQLPNLSTGGLDALNMPWAGMPAFSKAVWQDGHRLMVSTSSLQDPTQPWSTDDKQPAKLVWYNLDSTAPPLNNGQTFVVAGQQFGEIARTGDSHGAACPTWRHDGTAIVYSSTNGGNMDGRLNLGATDLYTVPFNNGNGGTAQPVPGASDPAWEEYYPAFSPDDQYLLYDRVPSGQVMYANPQAEIFLIPSKGGTPTRLSANDPSKCSSKTSPGVNNHFPKWSPSVQTSDGKTYYWVIFSANQADIAPVTSSYQAGLVYISQLYMTAIVVDASGTITTYPAVYLWTQDPTTVNTTPVWEDLDIPQLIQ
jgi:WD40-like Beta Propeller Repeat